MTETFFGNRYSPKENYTKNLILKGAMRGYIAAFYFEHPVDAAECRLELLRAKLTLFGVPTAEQESTIKRILSMDDYWLEIGNKLRDGLM